MSGRPLSELAAIYQRPAELLQNLIRFDTTNPPGNEAECVKYIEGLLKSAGFETSILVKDPARPNLVARLSGEEKAKPLLLYGHVDVVSTENQRWQHPPFEGKIVDGYVWGRGALDDKGGVAMLLAAFLRAKAEGLTPPGDVVLVIVCDEETGGEYGARYLVENHAELFEGISYAIGEFGGFTSYIGKQKYYPIMIAEKQPCKVRVTVRGPGGHGSLPVREGAMARLAILLQQLEKRRLPVHIIPVVRQMFEAITASAPFFTGIGLRLLLNPALTDMLLNFLGELRGDLEPLLHNTFNVTSIQGGGPTLMIPSEIVVEIIGSILPGYGPDDFLSELRQIVGEEVELEIVYSEQAPPEPDMGLFDTLRDILLEVDPEGVPMPLLLPSPTDGRTFSRLGIQTYGFLPMNLPPGFNFSRFMHAANERVPVEAIEFGTNAIHRLLQRFC
jgi:acetylornithine deacetylase/succinyl-diaminopimelate desuccinylase-like protein